MNGTRSIRRPRPAIPATLILFTLVLALAPHPAAAALDGVGGALGYASPEDLDGTASLSVHAEVAARSSHLEFVPNMRFWKVDGVRDLAPNVDVAYRFQPDRRWSPYLGGGLGLNVVHDERFDRSNTDVGLNMLGGVRFPGERNHYFVEGRFTASDVNQVSLQTGITFATP